MSLTELGLSKIKDKHSIVRRVLWEQVDSIDGVH